MHNSYYKIVFAILFLIVSLLHTSNIFAASIELLEPNISAITSIDQEFQVKVKLSINTDDGTVYFLRGIFFKAGTKNYCGYTWNGNEWFSGPYSSNQGWKNFPAVTVSSNSASMDLRTKIDPNDSECKEQGVYNFKVQRFTDKGSGSFDDQKELTVILNYPSVTLVPTAVIPSSTPKPTKIPASPTAISRTENKSLTSPIPSNTIKPIQINSVSIEEEGKMDRKESSLGAVMGIAGEEGNNEIELASAKTPDKNNNLQTASYLILLGSILTFGAAVTSAKIIRRKRKSLKPSS